MANLNEVLLIGRLTKDPETRQTQSGKSVANFSVAVNRRGKDAGADFIDCVAWESVAEFISKYFHKGNSIFISGSLQGREYEDRNGNKRRVWEVVVNRADFVEPKNASQNDFNAQNDNGVDKDLKPISADDFEEEALPF